MGLLANQTAHGESAELSQPTRSIPSTKSVHGAENAADLTAAFMREKRIRRRRFWWLVAITQALIAANCALMLFLNGRVSYDVLPLLMLGGYAAAIAPMFVAPWSLFLKPSRKQRAILDALSSLEEVAAIPSLWESLSFSDKRLARTATEKLTDLLPTVRLEHVGMFSEQQIRGLSALPLQSLSSPRNNLYDENLAVACLKAVAVVGGERNLDDVRRAATYGALTERDLRIRGEAVRCLAVLEARAVRIALSGTLLRPLDGAHPHNLLQPAASGPPDDTLLLRVTSPNSAES